MYCIKSNIALKLASPNEIILFKEDGLQLVRSVVAEHVVDYLINDYVPRYKNNQPEHIYFVDKVINELHANGDLLQGKIKFEEQNCSSGEGYDSLLNHQLDVDTHELLEFTAKKTGNQLVLVNDFLDPAILSLSIIDSGMPFLLLKPFGIYPAISPLFGNKGNCYSCFSERLLVNQPVRKWLYLNKDENISVPVEIQQGQLVKHIIEKLCLFDYSKFNIFDHQYTLFSEHCLKSNPSCDSCGNPDLYAEQSSESIRLKPVLKNNYRDGGFRSVDPDITLNKLLTLVDPVTGYICNSHTQKQVADKQNVIYFSSFYTQPYAKNSFKPEQFIYTTMGKGISHKQSQISALSEAVERIASQYHGDEPIQFARQSELTEKFVAIEQLTPFSESQYNRFKKELEGDDINQVHQCEKYQDEAINWTFGWSLISNEKICLPFNFCYANTPFEDKFNNFFHNGGSAGNCIEEAVLQGLFELIERDAVALWWYNKLDCPRVDYSSVDASLIKQIEQQLLPEYDVWVLDLTQDISVPVMCAIAQHKQTKSFVMGFGCHLDATISCQRALTELFQLIEIKDNNTSPFSFSEIAEESYLFGGKQLSELTSFNGNSSDLKKDIEYCLSQLEAIGVDVIVINNTRASLELASVKVIIPGLCHIFPYFGLNRLYQVPVSRGLQKQVKKESELNALALLI